MSNIKLLFVIVKLKMSVCLSHFVLIGYTGYDAILFQNDKTTFSTNWRQDYYIVFM